MTGLLTNLAILLGLVLVLWIGLRVLQGVFGTGSKKAAATESAARLVSLPAGSSGVLRRRFVRALTSQHVIMPSGERIAYGSLVVRVAPEDLERLDPDGDVDRLGDDAAILYRTHAQRAGWRVPDDVEVTVEVDHALRAGWIPPARGTGRADEAPRLMLQGRPVADAAASRPRHDPTTDDRPVPAWDVLQDDKPTLHALRPAPATVTVDDGLRITLGTRTATLPRRTPSVLGRHDDSPLRLDAPEVSFRHASVRHHDGEWQLTDLGSTNGTSVDGVSVREGEWVALEPGAVVRLAGVALSVADDAPGTVHLEGAHGAR